MKTPKLFQFEIEGKVFYEFPDGIELIKYDGNGHIISSITADYAKQYVDEEKWEAKNNVVATNASGDTLKTELLYWEIKTERIYTEEFVRIIRPDQIITGVGFSSDQSLENWRIKNPKGTIYVSLENNSEAREDSVQTETENGPAGVQRFESPLQFQK